MKYLSVSDTFFDPVVDGHCHSQLLEVRVMDGRMTSFGWEI